MPSYSPVFSAAFIEYTESTPNLTFEVPEGFTAVIRQVATVQTTGAYAFGLYIQNSDEAPALQVIADSSAGVYNTYQWQGRIVCPGGGIITAYVNNILDELQVYVGGYLLRNALT